MILTEKEMKNKDKEIEALRYAITTIAEIIHMELPLRYQDDWLERIVEAGIWKPETEEVGACCRNGCERCEQ